MQGPFFTVGQDHQGLAPTKDLIDHEHGAHETGHEFVQQVLLPRYIERVELIGRKMGKGHDESGIKEDHDGCFD